MWSRSAPARKPTVRHATAELSEGELHLSWSAEAAGEQEPECWAQWSSDRGRTWHALSTGLRGESAVVDARGLPSGRVAIRLLVSDGFLTASSRLVNVTVPRRPPEAAILSPHDGQTFASRSPMRLWGAASDTRGEPVPDEAARWVVDGDETASGFDAFIEAPKPGSHRVTLTVTTRDGSVDTSVVFATVELSEERDED